MVAINPETKHNRFFASYNWDAPPTSQGSEGGTEGVDVTVLQFLQQQFAAEKITRAELCQQLNIADDGGPIRIGNVVFY